MERIIYFFYIFFQGTVFLQFAIFITLYNTSAKKELLYYSLFLLFLGINFFISDPSTFGLGADELVLKSYWYKLVNTPLVITANLFYVLFLREFYRSLTNNKLFFSILNITAKALVILVIIFLVLFASGIHSDLFFNIINFIGTVTGIWLVSIIIREKMPFTRLMAYGFIINLVGTLLSVTMLILLTQGVKHLFVSEYPLVFVKLGILAEIFFFNLAIFKKWHWQEKELAIQQLQTELAVEKVKNQISKELHDDIGSTLSGMSMYSHMTLDLLDRGENGKAKNAVNIIQRSANEVTEKLGDLVWSVNRRQDSFAQLLERLQQYGYDICHAKSIRFQMQLPAADTAGNMPTEDCYHIFLVAKEAINNAAKYSGASSISVEIEKKQKVIRIAITDNGNGFDMATVKKGNGLMNMQKRAQELGAGLSIDTKPMQGCTVSLEIKIS